MAQRARRKRGISPERLRDQIIIWMDALFRISGDGTDIPAPIRHELQAIAHAMADILQRRIIP